MIKVNPDRHALFLLLSLLSYILLLPILEGDRTGELVLTFSMGVILVAAVMELSAKRIVGWPAIVFAAVLMALHVTLNFRPSHSLVIATSLLLIIFFTLASVGLFSYLGEPGKGSGRLYASASLYLLIAFLWFAIYRLLDAIHPGSIQHMGAAIGRLPIGQLLYFSLATLTTLGSNDMLPVTPTARMVAVLESATGVLYLAITVARLVNDTQEKS